MNKYGHLAMRRWEKTDPDRYQRIEDKEGFFSELGERTEIEIQQLQDAVAGPDRPGETYLEKVGRLNMARMAAEEQILAESVLIPGPHEDEDEGLEDPGLAERVGAGLELAAVQPDARRAPERVL